MWCGARNGRPAEQAPPSRPQALAIRATSSASPRASGGRIEGRRVARQRLARAGRADHQQAVPPAAATSSACRRCRLAAQVGEVRARERRAERAAARGRQRLGRGSRSTSAAARSSRVSGTTSIPPASAASGRVLGRRRRCRAGPARRAASAIASAPGTGRIEPSRASSPASAQRSSRSAELPGGGEQRRGDREVEPRAGLAQVGRREVGGDPLQRELEAAVDERRPHALARLAHGGVGQADDRERGQAAMDVDLDPDRAGLDAVQREGAGAWRARGRRYGAVDGRVARRM